MVGLYKSIERRNLVDAKPRPGTNLDAFEGVWAQSAEDCLAGALSHSRTSIDTTGRYDRFKNYVDQCDLINPDAQAPETRFELGCWKLKRQRGYKNLSTFIITGPASATLANRPMVRCDR